MGKRSALGAITGKARLEYYVPASMADALGGKGTSATCHVSVDKLIPYLRYEAERAPLKAQGAENRRARIPNLRSYGYDEATSAAAEKKELAAKKRAAKAGNAYGDLLKVIEAEVEKLRKRGVKGPIPVCIGRTTGRSGKSAPRGERIANAVHERFHADVRRIEADLGLEPFACSELVRKDLEPIRSRELWSQSFQNYSRGNLRTVDEELLARVEETRFACSRKKTKYCAETITDIVKWMPEDRGREFGTLMAGIKKQHGTPLNVFRKACRRVKGGLAGAPRKKGRKMNNALLIEAALPFVPPF
jgi:hypothetical protein